MSAPRATPHAGPRGGRPATPASEGAVPGWALPAGLVPLTALILEYAGSIFGSGPASSYPGWLVTVAWPQWARVAWWLLAAGGAALLTRGLTGDGGRGRWLVTGLTTAPFVVFAAGVATETSWSAWH